MSEHDDTILVASSSIDESSWRPVTEKLAGRGYNVLQYEADKVAEGSVRFDVHVNNDGTVIHYDNRAIMLDKVSAAWYRRPTIFSGEQEDKARQNSIDLERNAIQHALWNMVPEQSWLNSPSNINRAERKLTQLVLANTIGFDIPDTVTTNSWETIDTTLPNEIIFKPSYGMKLLYVAPLANDPALLPTEGNPFPGFWQPFLPKAREWRITVVGDRAFDAAIYTDDSAKDDWRRHQLTTHSVQFRAEEFPDRQKDMCFEYLGRLGLGFGAFDFVEDSDGKITFLECNANGQFGWLEDELGLPISEAIADELVSIAKRR